MNTYDVVIRYTCGLSRYTTMKARTSKEAIKLARDAFWIEGERGIVIKTSAIKTNAR